MAFDPSLADGDVRSAGGTSDDALPYSMVLELTVNDPDVIRELWGRSEGRERDEYALAALRLGTLALRQARGEVDTQSIRREGERLMLEIAQALDDHRTRVDSTLSQSLQEYFDPQNGRFNERVNRLLKKDGELESLLIRQITAEDSEMCRVLALHVGEHSPLFKLLSPTESEGLLHSLSNSVNQELADQRTRLLSEFSLDNKEGALAKLVAQLTDSNGQLAEGVQGKIDEMIRQFSFDDEQSAISRMRQTVDTTKEAISKHLTLDDDQSALSRLRRELMDVLRAHAEGAEEFRNEVRSTLQAMQIRREEAARSTTHGNDFEAEVWAFVFSDAQRHGDVATKTRATTGLIKNCKKGDAVLQLGPESAAPGANVALEAKEDQSYNLDRALAELEEARSNRDAEVGVFVFSKATAPAGLEPLARYGNDLVIVWDRDDVTSDVYLQLGLSVARALCTRCALERSRVAADFTLMDEALLEITKQIGKLEEIRPLAVTIQTHSGKIIERVRISTGKLARQAETLSETLNDLKRDLAESTA